jgi:aminoglycoside/choline kinase family phosphotransferase
MIDQLVLGDEEVSNWVNRSKTISSVVRLPGDASTRRYYRVTANAGQTYIVSRVEPFAGNEKSYPFLVVQRHLEKCGIDVPRILDIDGERGFLLLEDLGDATLLRLLQDVSNSDVERHHYQRVIDSLIQLQVAATAPAGRPDIDAFKLRFDHEKLMWEVNFTIEHFYQLYLKRTIRDADLNLMKTGFSEICQFLADQPTVLTHRDFHSRNVMVTPSATPGQESRLVMIDFQDARMGPAQYDLASLLRDSYYQLEEAQINRLLDYYLARWEAVSGQRLNRDEFIYTFDMMSVQRNFKAIGSFASFLNRRGDATYLKFIGNTFENIRRSLLKYPQYARLREVLFHYYYF